MSSNEYARSVGGSLKLKGSRPEGVKKKKKKPRPAGDADLPVAPEKKLSQVQTQALEGEKNSITRGSAADESTRTEEMDPTELDGGDLESLDPRGKDGKTASERAYEEMRRKRLSDRLQKEGVKTHKQRVEELNKYLSNLSEHHDMPRIGPG